MSNVAEQRDLFEPPAGTFTFDMKEAKTSPNISPEEIREHVASNIRRHLPQAARYQPNGRHCIIVGGGPSIAGTLQEVVEVRRSLDTPVVALNGAGNYLVSQNIIPSMVVVMDGRDCNTDFVREPIPGCKYFLASQCHPSLFDLCEGRDTTIFHILTTQEEGSEEPSEEEKILQEYYRGRYAPVPGGVTVGLRAPVLMRMLGFQFFHMFGIDCCYGPLMEHHAYEQNWQDDDPRMKMWIAGKEFWVAPWHVWQAHSFLNFVRNDAGAFNFQFYGDGLLAHMVRTGAEISSLKE